MLVLVRLLAMPRYCQVDRMRTKYYSNSLPERGGDVIIHRKQNMRGISITYQQRTTLTGNGAMKSARPHLIHRTDSSKIVAARKV